MCGCVLITVFARLRIDMTRKLKNWVKVSVFVSFLLLWLQNELFVNLIISVRVVTKFQTSFTEFPITCLNIRVA